MPSTIQVRSGAGREGGEVQESWREVGDSSLLTCGGSSGILITRRSPQALLEENWGASVLTWALLVVVKVHWLNWSEI